MRILLEGAGYDVDVVSNGAEGVERIAARTPDLILSDIMMPTMDGYAFCKAVKSAEATRAIPFVLLTSLGTAEKLRALEEGADDFLAKPAESTELLARARTLLRGKRLYDDLQVANAELHQLTEQLEERVAERTAELEATNEQLGSMSQQLWQAAKLATMGELAASIAHELNNPLGTVTLRIESMLAALPPGDPKREALEVVEGEVERMANLVANLLQFGRRSQQQISSIDVRREITATLDLIRSLLNNRGVAVVQDFALDVPLVPADRQLLRQLFLNLVTNAVDAMPGGGALTIRVTSTSERVVMEFSDTGVGIAPEDLARVGEPFFTTKAEGKGTGLGVPICQRIVQDHHGSLDIVSELGVGTTVRVELPLANGRSAALLSDDSNEAG
ncbi:MAG: hypothetical protein A3F84_28740 [Candidatus Handelsmanbacteria bacterium RIFCSPLOWO2_12_FULL_64_10]|uniref:histidine kinase n=1 Tax=Handelsmanbacteria sp. (strain RIFCSPLOWO2_12_FULL_64_10) TaxID=1817868 RepID=A0A1F6CB05_HANXR|nr:MAG: hypothetical protein A3F84_28740 [Candidatus Handelsmanbacteria bacterium RIFCSPLOWO2_12_FULL_64_10]